ncbi:hypothetical protein D3C81_732040 [compost metagenome]
MVVLTRTYTTTTRNNNSSSCQFRTVKFHDFFRYKIRNTCIFRFTYCFNGSRTTFSSYWIKCCTTNCTNNDCFVRLNSSNRVTCIDRTLECVSRFNRNNICDHAYIKKSCNAWKNVLTSCCRSS